MKNTYFTNSTGWPDENHYMTVSDLAVLSAKVIKDFPEFFHLFKEKTFTYNEISQNNRNPLLYSYKYADGLKTGYTEASGYSLAATAIKNNRRLVLIVSGLILLLARPDQYHNQYHTRQQEDLQLLGLIYCDCHNTFFAHF